MWKNGGHFEDVPGGHWTWNGCHENLLETSFPTVSSFFQCELRIKLYSPRNVLDTKWIIVIHIIHSVSVPSTRLHTLYVFSVRFTSNTLNFSATSILWQPNNLPTTQPTYQPTYLPNDLPTHLHTQPPASTYPPTQLPTHSPTHPPTYPPTYLPTYVPLLENTLKEQS